MQNQVQKILKKYQAEGLFTHAHCLAGSLTSSDLATDVALSSDASLVFDLASLTKAMSTAPLVYLGLIERQLSPLTATLGELIADWPKKLPDPFKSLLVRDLLQHRSGLPAWRNFWLGRLGLGLECTGGADGMLAQHEVIIDKLSTLAAPKPTTLPVYSDIGFILLGMAVEMLWQKPLPDLVDEYLNPEAGDHLVQYSSKFPAGTNFVATAYCPIRRRILVGEVHDENCAALGGATGHAGLFGTAYGVRKHLISMFESSQLNDFLTINSNYIMAADEKGKINDSLFGLRQGSDLSASGFAAGCGMGHLGFTGTAFWIDWTHKRFAILLTNRVISGRVNRAIGSLRAEIFAELN